MFHALRVPFDMWRVRISNTREITTERRDRLFPIAKGKFFIELNDPRTLVYALKQQGIAGKHWGVEPPSCEGTPLQTVASPFLLVVPNTLNSQWTAEFRKVMDPKYWQIIHYPSAEKDRDHFGTMFGPL